MQKISLKSKYLIYLFLFVLLNALVTYVVTTETLNRYIITFDNTFLGMLNSFVGNVSFLLLILIIVTSLSKNLKNRLRILLITTFILNGILFAIHIFNRFYGTSFTFRAFQIFQNPPGNFGLTIFFEALREIVIYYRIIIFIPFIVLLVSLIFIRAKHKEDYIFEFNIKTKVTGVLFYSLLLFVNVSIFGILTTNVEVVSSSKATYATQNLGIYNFLLLDGIGFDYNVDEKSNEDIYKELDAHNNNKERYLNYIDNKYYNKDVLLSSVENISGDLINNKTYTKGLLEDYNLVLVHLETFNYFLLEYPETRKHLYNLEALLEESYVFSNFYTTVGLGNSFDAELAVLTGLYANGTSTLAWDYNARTDDDKYIFQTLPKLFNEKDYITRSFHGNTSKFYNREIIHPDLFGFNKFYSQEVMLEEKNLTNEEVAELYEHEAGVWSTDRFTIQFMNEIMMQTDSKHMNYLLTMLPHTPFYYDPYYPDPYETDMYDSEIVEELDILTLKYFNYLKYYNEMMRIFVEDVNGYGDDYIYDEERLYNHKKTAYIFYGDHGSSIQFNDINYMFDNTLNNMEIRQKLLQTIAFIYVPGENLVTKNINGNNLVLYEGMLKGEQTLVRDQVDLYRTIIDLFNLPIEDGDFIFGKHGMSREPSFALDNKSLNIIVDSYIGNIRNGEIHQINNQLALEDFKNFKVKISDFKRSSDLAINNNLYKDFKTSQR